MRTPSRKTLRCCLFFQLVGLSTLHLSAEPALFLPAPPMQAQMWIISSTNVSTNLASAVDTMFQTGMADPRGCDYREIEIVVGRLTSATGVVMKTHGWVMPPTTITASTNFGIAWNGMVYPLVEVGNPANPVDDARTMVQTMTNVMTKNSGMGDFRGQACTDEEYSVGTQWLTPAKVAMLCRFAEPELVEACGRLTEKNEPFLLLATDRLWTMYDRATCAHMRGDDDLAYEMALSLTQARQLCEAEAKARGLRYDQRLTPDPKYSTAEAYFPFLDALPVLLRDQERRHQRSSPLRDPTTIADRQARITALVEQLDNVAGKQAGYAVDNDFSKNAIVQALIREGWEAVGPLLDCYEHDTRLTRVIPYSRFGGFGGGRGWSRTERTITGVREPAYVALENILETTQFGPLFTGKETAEEKLAVYARAAAAMRTYWTNYNGLPRAERLYAILQHEHGRWFEAASIIVQPTNHPSLPSGRQNYPWGLPVNLSDRSPMQGESLRSKSQPTVADLLIKRIEALAALSAAKSADGGAVDGASELNAACDLAICLAKWDPEAGRATFRRLTSLAYKKLDPKKHCSICSHMTLSAQLPVLVSIRARAGDEEALPEYARWLKSIDPQKFFLHPRQILTPLVEFPNDPAWAGLWNFLFQDANSPWFIYLSKSCTPDPGRMSSPGISAEEYFGTPFINRSPFRKFVARLLEDKSACGKLQGGRGSYWLDQRLSTDRAFGYSLTVPADMPDLAGKEFRACDFHAWLLSNRIQGAPEFQLYWTEEKRDSVITLLQQMLAAKRTLKTQPFQER